MEQGTSTEAKRPYTIELLDRGEKLTAALRQARDRLESAVHRLGGSWEADKPPSVAESVPEPEPSVMQSWTDHLDRLGLLITSIEKIVGRLEELV